MLRYVEKLDLSYCSEKLTGDESLFFFVFLKTFFYYYYYYYYYYLFFIFFGIDLHDMNVVLTIIIQVLFWDLSLSAL